MTIEEMRKVLCNAITYVPYGTQGWQLLRQAITALPEPATDDRERTHWDDCWRYKSHHPCWVARCERLER